MVALTSLSTASTLFQRMTSQESSLVSESKVATLQPRSALGASTAIGVAAKSVGSAILNALTAIDEKQQKSIKAALEYIDREYTKYETKWANLVKMYGDDPSVQDGLAKERFVGKALKQKILADPSAIVKIIEQIKAARPEVSQDGLFDLMIAELGGAKAARPPPQAFERSPRKIRMRPVGYTSIKADP